MGKEVKEGQRKTSVRELLRDAKKTNFDDDGQRRIFETTHEQRLSKVPAGNQEGILHVIANHRKDFAKYRNFVKWVVKTYPRHLEMKAQGGYNPLHSALNKQNHAFVELVLNHADKVEELLCQETDSSWTCLHFAIDKKSPLVEWIIEKAKQAGINPFIITDKSPLRGMTPLHMAVTPRSEDDEDDEDSDLGLWLGDSDEDELENDLAEDGSQEGGNTAFDHHHFNYSLKNTSRHLQPVGNGRLPPDTNQFNAELIQRVNSIKTSPQAAIHNGKPTRRQFDTVNVVKSLIHAYDRALVDCYDASGWTPFQARLFKMSGYSEYSSTVGREKIRRSILEGDEILRYMREYIIDNFSRQDAMKALYDVGNERVIEFDLSGLPRQEINTEYLGGLAKVLRFEGILKYVALPQLAFKDDEEPRLIPNTVSGAKISRGKGLHHMCAIFRWLKECNVKGVLELTVVDNGEASHSDEAIETCVDQLDVRIWNWYKVDLSCDVIIKKAPRVRDVNLYSSGNNAVLMGWSSPEGIAQLKELQRLRVYVQEGLENEQRVKDNMKKFIDTLKQQRPSLEADWETHEPDPNRNSVFTTRGTPRAVESKWMEAVEGFAEFLKRARPGPQVHPVRIAIIDDGIDTALVDFTDKIQVGESFCRLGELSGRRGAYYVPSGPHGTVMAQLICKLCPVVKLYIAQLEVLPGQHGQRSFTTESATEALKWAVRQKVDIVSMSWSIRGGRSSIVDLENAIKDADRDRIIMFCASTDDGSTTDNTYPGKEASCIRIGACTGTGAKLSWVSDHSSEYLLPGEAPRLVTDASAEPGITWTNYNHIGSFGSSVSTAHAAGLAGMLLYCDRLIGLDTSETQTLNTVRSDHVQDASSMGQGLNASNGYAIVDTVRPEYLRDTAKMRKAFTYLSNDSDSKKFPWLRLDDPDTLEWNVKGLPDKTEKTKQWLKDFMGKIKGL